MRNTPLMVMGVLLVVLGVAAFFSREMIDGKRDLVVEVGPITVTADTQKKVPLSPIRGSIGVVCGAVLGAGSPSASSGLDSWAVSGKALAAGRAVLPAASAG